MINNPYSLENRKVLVVGTEEISIAVKRACEDVNAEVTYKNSIDEIETFICECPVFDRVSINLSTSPTILSHFLNSDSITQSFNANVIKYILLIKALLKNKNISKGGSIVFSSSLSGIDNVHYADSLNALASGAINAEVKCMALEYALKGIRVILVRFGVIMTKQLTSTQILSSEELAEKQKYFPLKRFGRPSDVANAILYFLSDASSWITGESLKIDGGYSVL